MGEQYDVLAGILGGLFSNNNTSQENRVGAIAQGWQKDWLASISGAAAGGVSNLIGQGISAAGGNSKLSSGIGSAIATGLGTVGGTIANNLVKTGSLLGNSGLLFANTVKAANSAKIFTTAAGNAKLIGDAASATKFASLAEKFKNLTSAINPYALGMTVVGSGLLAALGKSNEYNGKYGGVTLGMDTAYDTLGTGLAFAGPVGTVVSGAMALNKGLGNLFGSTDGLTVQDAILGSAFMPAPIKWINMWGSRKTGSFNNQSWMNTEKTNSFMQNAFGDLGDKFDLARNESNKVYGTFSRRAYHKALDNINFANSAYGTILDMADLNIYQNIRANDMASINNLRYAQNIQGGYNPIAVGKQGMKIFNNATNHNIGMRLLSGAALIDNKQMILCSATD